MNTLLSLSAVVFTCCAASTAHAASPNFQRTAYGYRAEPTPQSQPSPGVRPSGNADRTSDEDDSAAAGVRLAPLLGIGTGNYLLGVGIRAGYTLPNHVYAGGTLMYHYGTTPRLFGVRYSWSLAYPAAEVGYEFRIRRFGIRPYGGIALTYANTTTSYEGSSLEELSSSTWGIGIYPGCSFTYDIPHSSFFVGGDARYLVGSASVRSLSIFGSAGVAF